ncbi:hypothetical protein [Bacterioplanoides sp.]|uniref:hypothetical protein n=1 Tax=Bacterioplanoides sp. TaxID=2066072 RepID=UPI003AFFE863
MIIWRGFGWLVPVIVFVAFLATQMSLNSATGDAYYKQYDWPKAAAIALSSILIAALGYYLNYKKREIFTDPETGKTKKSNSHTLFFIPVEFWAVIIPVFSVYLHNHNLETSAQEVAYIQTPVVNDIYALDLAAVFNGIDKEYKYGTMKVIAVYDTHVDVQTSDSAYNARSGVRKDIRKGKASEDNYYSDGVDTMTRDELLELQASGDLFQVHR